MAELRARIDALLRRAAGPAADPTGEVQVGALGMDVAGGSSRSTADPST